MYRVSERQNHFSFLNSSFALAKAISGLKGWLKLGSGLQTKKAISFVARFLASFSVVSEVLSFGGKTSLFFGKQQQKRVQYREQQQQTKTFVSDTDFSSHSLFFVQEGGKKIQALLFCQQ